MDFNSLLRILIISLILNQVTCEDNAKNQSAPEQPVNKSIKQSQLIKKVQLISSFYPDFIDNILSDQKFFHSAISSVSHVFYNDWVKKLNKKAQKRYLRIMLINIKSDTSNDVSQYFQILSKIFQDEQIGKVLLNYIKLDQTTQQFRKYIQKKNPYLSDQIFSSLSYNEKCQLFIMALNDFYNDYSYNFKYLPTKTIQKEKQQLPAKNQTKP